MGAEEDVPWDGILGERPSRSHKGLDVESFVTHFLPETPQSSQSS